MQESIRQIFALMFQRLTLSKTAKYVKSFVVFLCFYAAKVGASQLIELIDNIQAQYVLTSFFIPTALTKNVCLHKSN